MRVTDDKDLTLLELMFTASCSAAMPLRQEPVLSASR